MKALLDTNIVIHRENTKVTNQSIGLLFYWLDHLHYDKCIHPYSMNELRKYNKDDMQDLYDAKLTSYSIMRTVATQTEAFKSALKEEPNSENDRIDNQLLYEVYCGRADILITEDKRLRKKASYVGIQNKVFSINAFIEKCTAEHPQLVTYKALAVKKDYIGNIDGNNGFFDSLRESYSDFNEWFAKKSDEEAYICYSDNKDILGFLYLKVEECGTDYHDIEPIFTQKKRLKIGTFKVDSTGFRLGERFIKIIFDNAVIQNAQEIYVTMFNHREELQALEDLLIRWGFSYYGIKRTKDGDECVLTKSLERFSEEKTIKENYPLINYNSAKYILPIFPQYHTSLFPDSRLNNENEIDFLGSEPHRYALQKVYITWGMKGDEKPGDIVLFYRVGETLPKKYSSVVTTIGVIEEIREDFSSLEELLNCCQNRSVFSKDELTKFWHSHRDNLRVIQFIFIKSLSKRLTLSYLWENSIVVAPNGPRPFHRMEDDQFYKLINDSNTELIKGEIQ
ncbi:MAG: hypothetical protein IKG44_06120 [Mogibacterium sp.]|nr:hypothetical protein [Mogibacterium sp.]